MPRVIEVTTSFTQSCVIAHSLEGSHALQCSWLQPSFCAGSTPIGRDKADPTNVGSVGAPMAGTILEVIAKPGADRDQRPL